MPFRLLNEYNQKKLSTARSSLPAFVFLLGVLITLLLANAFQQSEVKLRQENLKSFAREFSKIQNLVLNNSILRIQSYSEISNLAHGDSQFQKRIVKEIISSTMFQRASLFKLISREGDDGLPELVRLQQIQTESDKLPVRKARSLENLAIRKKIKRMLDDDLPNSLAITHNEEADAISLLWHSTSNRNEIIIFSSSLASFFKDAPKDPELNAVIYDAETEQALSIKQGGTEAFKLVEEQKQPLLSVKNRYLLYSHYLVSDFYGISIHWFQNTQNKFSFYVIMVALFGIAISLLTSLFLNFILDQNRRIYTLVVNRTEQLESAMNQAQEANLAKTRFLANMSHELRTPLNLILGMIELQQLNTSDKKGLEYLRNMQTAGEHLLNLITELLSMSKEEPSDLKVNKSPFNVPVFFEEIAGIVGPECRKKNLAFSLIISEKIPATLIGDPVKIRQILLNLLRNSLKYTQKGHLSLHVSLAPKEICEQHICYLRFKVSDTGVGIPKNKMNQIFDRFFQLESSKLLTEGGVGLGLSIVKDLVSKMNGNITVKSELGEGSTFSVDLDLECRDEQPWIEKFQKNQNTLSSIRIIGPPEKIANVRALLPAHIFELTDTPAESILAQKDFSDAQAFVVTVDQPGLISTLQRDYPDKKIVIIGNENYILEVTSLKNVFVMDDTPVLPSQLFELLEYRSHRKKAAAVEEAATAASLAMVEAPERKINALVVDDDSGNRQLMKAYLDNPNFIVSFASDGEEAFELFKKSRPDIVIADLRMPKMNGFELSAAITDFERKNKHPITPFILLTADALESTSEEAQKYAISMFLTKPIRRNKILKSIMDLTQLPS